MGNLDFNEGFEFSQTNDALGALLYSNHGMHTPEKGNFLQFLIVHSVFRGYYFIFDDWPESISTHQQQKVLRGSRLARVE